jgi:peptide/nickel transport system substrate-binding protein
MARNVADHPLTRRALIAGAGTGAIALYLAGELPSAGAATGLGAVPGPPATGGKRGGRVVNAWKVEGNSYDPIIGYTGTGWEAICNLLFSPLYSYGADGSPKPNAAAAMPTITQGGTVYRIPLRTNVLFHNGRPVLAADYKYSWERLLDPKLASWASSYVYTIKGAKELFEKKAPGLAGVKVVDPHTLEVTLTQPDVTFLYALTQPFMSPVPKEVVQQYGKTFSTHAVGNGPFKLEKYDSQGQTMLFSRFDKYFWPGLPYLDEVQFIWGIDPGVQILKLQRGEVDLLGDGFSAQALARVNASSSLKKYLFEEPLLSARWTNLHPRVPAFKDKRVRQALNYATDRAALERLTSGEASAWGVPFPKGMLGKQRTFKPYTFDLDRAKSLMKAAGVTNVQATLWVGDDPEPLVGQFLQQAWQAVGVHLTLKQATADAINELSIKDKVDAWISTYYAIYPTAIDLISQYWQSDGAANYTHYKNAQVDSLTAQARRTVDPAKRDALLAKVETLVGNDAPAVFLENVNWLMGRNPDRLKNFNYSGVYGTYYDRLWVSG